MPQFGQVSKDRLATCDLRLQQIMNRVIELVDISVLEGRRTWARQSVLLEEGKTTVGPGHSKHNSPIVNGDENHGWMSRAVDIAPYPIDWDDAKRFIYVAGIVVAVSSELGYRVRWGGNWDMDQVILDDQSFDDLPHFELVD